MLDFKNSERDAIIMLCEQFSIDGGEDVADKFKQINRRMWDMFELGLITREEIFILVLKNYLILRHRRKEYN